MLFDDVYSFFSMILVLLISHLDLLDESSIVNPNYKETLAVIPTLKSNLDFTVAEKFPYNEKKSQNFQKKVTIALTDTIWVEKVMKTD